jgi:hypothetical protein
MIEKLSKFLITGTQVEIVPHDEHDVNIVRFRLGCDKATKDYQALKLASRLDKIKNAG